MDLLQLCLERAAFGEIEANGSLTLAVESNTRARILFQCGSIASI